MSYPPRCKFQRKIPAKNWILSGKGGGVPFCIEIAIFDQDLDARADILECSVPKRVPWVQRWQGMPNNASFHARVDELSAALQNPPGNSREKRDFVGEGGGAAGPKAPFWTRQIPQMFARASRSWSKMCYFNAKCDPPPFPDKIQFFVGILRWIL